MTSRISYNIVAYGAAAEPEAHLLTRQRIVRDLKHAYHLSRDRRNWRKDDLSQLDYRNYIDPTTANRGDQAIVDSIVSKISHQLSPVQFTRANWGNLKTIDSTASMIAVCGSGYLALDKTNQLSALTRKDFELFSSLSVPIVLFGIGINQLLNAKPKNFGEISQSDFTAVRQFLNRCNLISVRDSRTQRALQQLTDKDVHMVADPALYFSSPAQNKAAKARDPGSPLRIGFNIPFHGPQANSRVSKDLRKYIEFLQNLKNQGPCEFYYLAHYTPERVVAQLMKDAGIPFTVVSGAPNVLEEAYAKLDLHVGGMLHSCILATSAGTPCIGLAYDVKHEGFFEVMEMPEQCVSAIDFDVAKTLDACRKVLATLPAVREKIARRRQTLEQEFDRFVQTAVTLIDKPHAGHA